MRSQSGMQIGPRTLGSVHCTERRSSTWASSSTCTGSTVHTGSGASRIGWCWSIWHCVQYAPWAITLCYWVQPMCCVNYVLAPLQRLCCLQHAGWTQHHGCCPQHRLARSEPSTPPDRHLCAGSDTRRQHESLMLTGPGASTQDWSSEAQRVACILC